MKLPEAIEVLKKWQNLYDGTSELLEWDMGVFNKAIDTVVAYCEQKTYTPAEMESFYTWANDNGWSYGELTELWYNDEEDLEGLIIDDVLKIWEETK